MRRHIVPSSGLLRYLHCVIQQRSYCEAVADPVLLRRDLRGSGQKASTSTSPLATDQISTESSIHDSYRTESKVHHRIQRPVTSLESSYSLRIKSLAKSKNWSELKSTLEHGRKNNIKLTQSVVKRLITTLVPQEQNELALSIFRDDFEPTGSEHERTVSSAIFAAFKSRNLQECERIYSKYSHINYKLQTHHALLKCYLQSYDFNTAREFLHQLERDQVATEESLQIYLIGSSRLANNLKAVEREFSYWEDSSHRRELSAASYAVYLECLLVMDMAKYEQVRDRIHDKFKKSPELEHVYIQHAIMTRDEKQLVRHVNKLGTRGNILDNAPFLASMKYFAINGDIEALGFATGALTKSGFDIDTDAMNVIGLGLYKTDSMFDIAHYLENVTANKSTLNIVSKALIHRSVNKPLTARELLDLGATTTVSDANDGNSSGKPFIEDAICKIKAHAQSGRPDKGIELLKEFSKRGVVPPRHVYMALIRGLAAHGHSNSVHSVCELMQADGYTPDASLKFLLLKTVLVKLELSNEEALLRLTAFIEENPASSLALQDRTAIAAEFEHRHDYATAIYLLDCKRKQSELITSQNHDSQSLQALIRCHRKQGDFMAITDVISLLLSAAGQPTIALKTMFFRELNQCFKVAVSRGQTELSMQLWSQMLQCKEYRQAMIEQSERDLLKVRKLYRK